tara:strand:- start:384 stop:1268 length:885 start_codon:yes stop_codon:yes gene_type:complete
MYIDKPKYFEYTSAAVPVIKDIKPSVISPNNQSHNSVTTPNLFARYFTFNNKGDRLNDNLSLATSHEYYIIQGSGKTIIINQDGFSEIKWNKGDVLVLPFIRGKVIHIAFEDKTMIFTADDSPLVEFLNCKPSRSRFLPTLFKNDDMLKHIDTFNKEKDAQNRNRNGILLSTNQMVKEKLNTITHTMWSLLNSIGPNTIQKPHRHNSLAIDLCTDVDKEASKNGLVYTLMGKSLNENNEIIDPIKMVWKKNCTFTTPPGWWHSHHNESDKPAWVFPVQDAGLHTYMRTLDIQFS